MIMDSGTDIIYIAWSKHMIIEGCVGVSVLLEVEVTNALLSIQSVSRDMYAGKGKTKQPIRHFFKSR